MNIRPLWILVAAMIAVALPSGLSAEASAKAEALAKEGALSAGDLTIVRAFTGWRDAASFKRISEYFDGRENSGGATIIRSHPEQRTGFYFLLRVANPGAPRKVQFQLQFVQSGAPAPGTTVFPAEIQPGSAVFQLGLTGPEWQDAKAQPVAWRVLIIATDDGRVLASEKSYLWEKPAAQ